MSAAVNGMKADKLLFPRRSSTPMSAAKGMSFSSEVQSDIILNVDGVTFSLHKFPLMTRSGRIRRLVGEELEDGDSISGSPPVIEFSNFPGGPDTFELAAKFCYNINFEITTTKVACLRCAAEFLEMTDDYGDENLVTRTEAFLKEVVFKSLDKCAEVLHSCEPILSLAEEVRMVNRCIDAIALKVHSEQQKLSSLLQMEGNHSGRWNHDEEDVGNGVMDHNGDANHNGQLQHSTKAKVEWWAEYLSPLRIDLYQRVFAALRASGVRIDALGGTLMHYAQTALKGHGSRSHGPLPSMTSSATTAIRLKTKHHLDISFGNGLKSMQHEQRSLLETIVSLLPTEKNMFPTSFLLSLLRSAIAVDTTVACRLDLERRIGAQFEEATVDDLLIPTVPSRAGDAMFDVDVVQRVLMNYLQQQENKGKHEQQFTLNEAVSDYDDVPSSPSLRKGMVKVAKLIDMYLAEVGADPNLKASKFASLAEQLPSCARVLDDGLYRAIDIFLKGHPTLSDMERKKLCKVLDCQKLSKEASMHAAQNERLPVQMVVQVLYFEQLKMRNAMGGTDELQHRPFYPQDNGTFTNHQLYRGSSVVSPKLDTHSSLHKEIKELKEVVAKLQHRIAELQKENMVLKQDAEKANNIVSGNSSRFFSVFSRRLGKMNPFSSKAKEAMIKPSGEPRPLPRQRRHSVS